MIDDRHGGPNASVGLDSRSAASSWRSFWRQTHWSFLYFDGYDEGQQRAVHLDIVEILGGYSDEFSSFALLSCFPFHPFPISQLIFTKL